MNPLIEVAELNDSLGDVSLFDIRWALTDPNHGRSTYEAAHIPGAVFVDLDDDLAAPPGLDGRHPLPDLETWAATLGQLGVSTQSDVVVYDDAGGTIAARMWWMLDSIGHKKARLLNGGFDAWIAAGLEVETGPRSPDPAQYPTPAGFSGVVGHQELEDRLIVDVRAVPRYRGEHEPVDPKPGHIPGAINKPVTDNLDDAKRFIDQARLVAAYSDLEEKPVVSCGSGVNACHTALAMRLAGLDMPDVYVGSYSEWSTLDLPVVTGSAP
ncbi:MAG: sulfurtransferase [Actinomycetota bacterium]|nr:sulfurtransferase [Actinomycetota bacterium]